MVLASRQSSFNSIQHFNDGDHTDRRVDCLRYVFLMCFSTSRGVDERLLLGVHLRGVSG